MKSRRNQMNAGSGASEIATRTQGVSADSSTALAAK